MKTYVGIDPGEASGAIVSITDGEVGRFKLEGMTEQDIYSHLCGLEGDDTYCVIEQLGNRAPPQNGHPGRGSKANWSLSGSYHGLRMALIACCIPFRAVSPAKWQKAMGCMTKGDKKVSQRRAQELYPALKVTQWQADAILLATYCRQNHAQLF